MSLLYYVNTLMEVVVVTYGDMALRLVLAAITGAIIGLERELRGKPAGFRTHILVSLGAAIFTLAGTATAAAYGQPVDAVRAMVGVAQGVGFLGAGLILQTKGEVRWLTTAAALWVTAGIGAALGIGTYVLAIIATGLVMVTLIGLDKLEDWLLQRFPRKDSTSGRDTS